MARRELLGRLCAGVALIAAAGAASWGAAAQEPLPVAEPAIDDEPPGPPVDEDLRTRFLNDQQDAWLARERAAERARHDAEMARYEAEREAYEAALAEYEAYQRRLEYFDAVSSLVEAGDQARSGGRRERACGLYARAAELDEVLLQESFDDVAVWVDENC